MDAIIDSPAILFFIAGLGLLGIDIFIVGVSPLMFVAAGALVTSLILYVTGWKSGILYLAGWKPGPLEALAICAVVSLLIAVAGKRPLQAFQNSNVEEDTSSDGFTGPARNGKPGWPTASKSSGSAPASGCKWCKLRILR
jgi:inner membrane protein